MWFEKYYKLRKQLIIGTVIVSILSLCALPFLKFAFNFEQFFPTGDEDLEFFQSFIEEFETDDNFLLVAFKNTPSIYDTSFLSKLSEFTTECQDISYVTSVQSITNFNFPILTPIGPSFRPAVHKNNKEKLVQDSIRLDQDERIKYNLINEDATSTIVLIKNDDGIQIDESKIIMNELNALIEKHKLPEHHILGRAYFQTELSSLQMREIIISTLVSGLLISFIMILIFSKWRSILIALGSIGLGLIIFMGSLSILGRQLTLMAALYPILMLIVGTSDVVHIMSKYFDELRKGETKKRALEHTIKQIGLATLLTSLTTAAGFATLLSSRIIPIKDFGINSALGVIIAYIVVITFTLPLMSYFQKDHLVGENKRKLNWNGILTWTYHLTLKKPKTILVSSIIFVGLSFWGISMIHTKL